jgi:hypothetical protein
MYVGIAGQELNRLLGYEPFSALTGGLIMLGFAGALLGGAYALFLRRDA